MFDLVLDESFLKLLTLAGRGFYIAFFLSLGLLVVQSIRYTRDRKFRQFHFHVGFICANLYFLLNVFFTQRASVVPYRPLLVGSRLYEQVLAYLTEAADAGTAVMVTTKDVEQLLFGSFFKHSWPAMACGLVIVGLGLFAARNRPPEWIEGRGIDVVQATIPNLIDYSIKSLFLQGLFISSVLAFVTVVLFDLVQLANLENIRGVSQAENLPAFFQERKFESQFFVALAISPILLSWSIGTIWRLRYQMTWGADEGYRPDKLRALVMRHRRHQKTVTPELGDGRVDEENDGPIGLQPTFRMRRPVGAEEGGQD